MAEPVVGGWIFLDSKIIINHEDHEDYEDYKQE